METGLIRLLIFLTFFFLPFSAYSETRLRGPSVSLDHGKLKLKIFSDDSSLVSYKDLSGKNIKLNKLPSRKRQARL